MQRSRQQERRKRETEKGKSALMPHNNQSIGYYKQKNILEAIHYLVCGDLSFFLICHNYRDFFLAGASLCRICSVSVSRVPEVFGIEAQD